MADTAAHSGPEILEENAEGKIKSLYDDIKATLRVPMVPLIFRVLAAQYPDYLQIAWRALQPNMQTVFFERRADDIRVRAVEGMGVLGTPPRAGEPDVGQALRLFHYVDPKLLLAVTALQAATFGQLPQLQQLPREEKQQLARRIPDGLEPIREVDPEQADDRIRAVYEDVKVTLGVQLIDSDYRALAAWPDYLETAWASLKSLTAEPSYRQVQLDLGRVAQQAASMLPFRMEVNPHTLRHSGISEHEIDGVKKTLVASSRSLPALVASVAFLAGGELGHDAALQSPFPAPLL